MAWLDRVCDRSDRAPAAHGSQRSAALALERIKIALYALILAIAVYWCFKDQVLYFWDEIVWVLGFLIIDWNIRDWQTFRRALSVSPSAA